MDRDIAAYLAAVAERVVAAAGDRVAGVWAVGSLALGGFDRRRSDVDVQAVVDRPLAASELQALAAALDHARLPCPARKLEFVLYERDAVPRFALNLNTGTGMETHAGLDPGREPGFWFVIDVAIARQSGITLAGAPPAAVLPELPRDMIARALAEALDWFAAEGTPQQLATARARAAAWKAEGRWVSKSEAATRG